MESPAAPLPALRDLNRLCRPGGTSLLAEPKPWRRLVSS